ncbi:MAG: hypothetical protein LBU76_06060 [Azoarcus sp.]|jgi:hypothetical protein|nr:hypothetical protein [Azoarcus sp.]
METQTVKDVIGAWCDKENECTDRSDLKAVCVGAAVLFGVPALFVGTFFLLSFFFEYFGIETEAFLFLILPTVLLGPLAFVAWILFFFGTLAPVIYIFIAKLDIRYFLRDKEIIIPESMYVFFGASKLPQPIKDCIKDKLLKAGAVTTKDVLGFEENYVKASQFEAKIVMP